MPPVDTMAFSTHGWTRSRPDRSTLAGWFQVGVRRWLTCALLMLGCLLAVDVSAREPEVPQQEVRRSGDGAQLAVRLVLEPSAAVEDALLKGVPIYFVWQAEVVRERWYWTDKRISSATRVLRVAYQPLTRRWRVSVSTEAVGGVGQQFALHQSFDSLADALSSVSRVAGWQIAEPGRLEEGVRYTAQWRFRLDLSLLPRPFQIGMANQPGWDVEVQRSIEVPARNEGDAAPEAR